MSVTIIVPSRDRKSVLTITDPLTGRAELPAAFFGGNFNNVVASFMAASGIVGVYNFYKTKNGSTLAVFSDVRLLPNPRNIRYSMRLWSDLGEDVKWEYMGVCDYLMTQTCRCHRSQWECDDDFVCAIAEASYQRGYLAATTPPKEES